MVDVGVVFRAATVRLEALLGIDFDGDKTVGEKVEWVNDCVDLFEQLS